MTQTTVLVTCVGGELSVQSVNSLRRAQTLDMRVVGVDADPTAMGQRWADAFHRVPMGSDDGYADALAEVCRTEGVQVVVPGSDEEALAIAENLPLFEDAGVRCSVPRPDVARLLRNKGATFDFLASCDIPLPAYRRIYSLQEVAAAAQDLGYPAREVVVKPSSSRGGRGVWTLREGGLRSDEVWGRARRDVIDLEALVELMEETGRWNELLAMENLDGEIYDVDVLADASVVHYAVSRRRVNPLGVPFRGCVVQDVPALTEFSRDTAAALDLRGLYDLDVVLAADGTPQLLEVNPRPSASVVATIEAGLPLTEFLIRMLLGLEVPKLDVTDATRVRPYVRLAVDYV